MIDTGLNMSRFVKDQFSGTEYLVYGPKAKFVARFKYKRGGRASFVAFLIKNFTVEEYFSRLDAGEAPLKILEGKGYLLPHIKRWLKRDGYEVSVNGFKKMIEDQMNTRNYKTLYQMVPSHTTKNTI